MGLKKGDIIDEHKRHPDGCGLVLKVMSGGEGFEKVICCGHELTEEDVVSSIGSGRGRKKGKLLVGMTIDERKNHPDSCGLRVMIMDGGAGFKEIICCGHSVTARAMQDLSFGQASAMGSSETTHEGNA
ncbi:MAG: hypothetical protein JSU59_06045 [Nitrospirota bacterium]|nr:MAG: hypothetical protein JSU59_06045 [Nitrospirota bacterium]